MRYLGGKARIGRRIATFLETQRKNNQVYIEPFLGAANVMQYMMGKRIGSDLFYPVMKMWQSLQGGWLPPETISEQEYKQAKQTDDLCPELVSYIGIGCSFGSKLWGGYARDNHTGRDFSKEAYKGVVTKAIKLSGVDLDIVSYKAWRPRNWLIYCDPPYADTESYSGVEKFDNSEFWSIIRQWSQNNTVFVSEYKAPDDFECVLSFNAVASTGQAHQRTARVEKVFKYAHN